MNVNMQCLEHWVVCGVWYVLLVCQPLLGVGHGNYNKKEIKTK